ncbi:MAG: DMT family transporter [Rhodobacteraceae bacterium]|jgi:drug/metabolite transporter (DMT)-like permease|nr:DMT family transporter [Paracoccaceae bacterium]
MALSPRARATATGFGAVLLWSLLAVLTVGTAPVPPLMLNALSFALGAGVGGAWLVLRGGAGRLASVSWKVYAFGTAGLFGYHALYFSALRLAPPAEAGLVAYLWPLLIVLFSGLLPGERLRAGHVAGALAAFAGAGLIVAERAGGAGAGVLPGLLLAFLSALTWAGYSVISRRLGTVPTEAVAVFCLATAALSALAHAALESPSWPADAAGWAAVAALGLGPVGLAFYLWDVGVKRGDIQLLGVASYAAPLLSTLALVAAGHSEPTLTLLAAAGLIAGGAVIAARAGRQAAVSPG